MNTQVVSAGVEETSEARSWRSATHLAGGWSPFTGVIWTTAALVILHFDAASVATVSVLLGCMFVFSGVQQIVPAALTDR